MGVNMGIYARARNCDFNPGVPGARLDKQLVASDAKLWLVGRMTQWPNRKPPGVRMRKPSGPPEWMLQAAFIAELHRLEAEGWPMTCAGDMNAGRRGYQEAAKCKAMGMRAGEPDVRLYGAAGRILFVEIKTAKGRKSATQEARHKRLAELGHSVLVIAPINEDDARTLAVAIAREFCDPSGRIL